MHRALVVTSQYAPNSGYPNHPDWAESEALLPLLSARGYSASALLPGPGLVEVLRQHLREANAHQSLLLYFSGYVILTEAGEPALLLPDGAAAPLRVSQLVAKMGASFGRVLLVVDGVLGSATEQVPEVSGLSPEATVCAMTLECIDVDNVGALVCVRPWKQGPPIDGPTPEPFSSAFLQALNTLGARPGSVDSVQIMEWLSEQTVRGHLGLSETDPNFMLLPQRKYPSNPVGLLVPTHLVNAGTPATPAPVSIPETQAAGSSVSGFHPLGSTTATPPDEQRPETSVTSKMNDAPAQPEPVFITPAYTSAAPPNRAWVAVEPPVSWQPGTWDVPRPEDEAALLKRTRDAVTSGDDEEAYEQALRCLEFFPQSVAAVQIAADLSAKLDRWDSLAELYESLLLTRTDIDGKVKLRIALSRLYSAKLNDTHRALEVIEGACQLQPKNASLHLEAAALCEAAEQITAAEEHYRAALRLAPLVASTYRRAAAFFTWVGDTDAAWNTASILTFLGEANEHELALVKAQRSASLPQLKRPLCDADFALGLAATATDPALTELMSEIAPIARLVLHGSHKRQEDQLQGLVQAEVLNSTTTLARSLVWASQLLGVPTPALYLSAEAGVVRPLLVDFPAWEVSRSLGHGVSAHELIFCFTRSLVLMRPENHILIACQTKEELLGLLEACCSLRSKGADDLGVSEEAQRLASRLKKQLSRDQLKRIEAQLGAIPFERLGRRVDAWLAQAGFAQNRVGLIACGDPALAAQALDRLAPSPHVTRTAQLEDLFGFAVSESCARLRATLGVSLTRPVAAE
ncbi:MAG: hypothetical protein RJA70_1448 [Pseudomonadota bacterium]|jgi:tetratricopeptide (TPR) repeat protein